MTIREMHELFRTLAQQVGMEAVRAILPNEVDRLLNLSIVAFIRNNLSKVANTQYRERIAIRSNTITPINALRTLYKVVKLGSIRVESQCKDLTLYNFDVDSDDIMVITDIATTYKDFTTLPYYCRFIEPEQYHILRNDFCNSPSYDSPIATMLSDDNQTMTFRMECGKGGYVPDEIQVGYIKQPNIVSFDNNVNCDLPEHTHSEIVANAAKIYLSAVSLTTKNIE